MSEPVLRLLAEVSYAATPVTGERSQALLAALVAAEGRAVPEVALAEAIWGREDQPVAPARALQVVVSRTRAQSGADVVVRVERGYRLGLAADRVDAMRQGVELGAAQRAERSGELSAALSAARAAHAHPVLGSAGQPGALEDLRHRARERRAAAALLMGRTASALGDHEEALPLLESVAGPDEATLVALLRSTASVRGAAVALARYEVHRARLADDLGVDPGPVLVSLHAELLAADRPVRSGLRYDATSLVGRDDDVRALRAVVAESRVVSILGPGGLGKTRLAHLLGRRAEQPVVHMVELVGVVAADDVIGEVGTALGVRDSVTARRTTTPEQRRDVRGRIARSLDQAPTLLILDNCEHVVGAVADLVAFLVAATRDLRIVTTTRAPLGIAAERVFALPQLGVDDAARLFEQRARAARPGVGLPSDVVRRIVARLDGLPLAVELAAARVRAMSVDDVDRRLDDRFALLRGTDRTAPDRHQTLLAVIDWSWDLLDAAERHALGRLSLFRDGFALDAAEAVLGPGGFAAVESLVGQSLLVVREEDQRLRYRMLETVREFGQVRLREAGDASAARAARRDWAIRCCRSALARLYGVDQIAVVRDLSREEADLSDVLHEALAAGDASTVVVVVAALGGCWTIRGAHLRIVALNRAVEDTLADWTPRDDEIDDATAAAAVLALNVTIAELDTARGSRALLRGYGERSSDPATRAFGRVLSEVDPTDREAALTQLAHLAESPDRQVSMLALRWLCHWLENDGDAAGAAIAARRALALWCEDDGPWARALTIAQLAALLAQLGDLAGAGELAVGAIDVVDALDARDDAIQLRGVLVGAALARDDLDTARAVLAEIDAREDPTSWGGAIVAATVRAEVALAVGDLAGGLALWDRAVVASRAVRVVGLDLSVGQEPWRLMVESAALCAHAHHDADAALLAPDPGSTAGAAVASASVSVTASVAGTALAAALAGQASAALAPGGRGLDYPVAGGVLLALGLWRLRQGGLDDVGRAEAIELVALAERFGYSRLYRTMAWSRAETLAEQVHPGALAQSLHSYGERRGKQVQPEARALVERLFG